MAVLVVACNIHHQSTGWGPNLQCQPEKSVGSFPHKATENSSISYIRRKGYIASGCSCCSWVALLHAGLVVPARITTHEEMGILRDNGAGTQTTSWSDEQTCLLIKTVNVSYPSQTSVRAMPCANRPSNLNSLHARQ
jgi:hypothetical protein